MSAVPPSGVLHRRARIGVLTDDSSRSGSRADRVGEVPVQRCVRHEERTAVRHTWPSAGRPPVLHRMRRTCAETSYGRGRARRGLLTSSIARTPATRRRARARGVTDRDPARDQGPPRAGGHDRCRWVAIEPRAVVTEIARRSGQLGRATGSSVRRPSHRKEGSAG